MVHGGIRHSSVQLLMTPIEDRKQVVNKVQYCKEEDSVNIACMKRLTVRRASIMCTSEIERLCLFLPFVYLSRRNLMI